MTITGLLALWEKLADDYDAAALTSGDMTGLALASAVRRCAKDLAIVADGENRRAFTAGWHAAERHDGAGADEDVADAPDVAWLDYERSDTGDGNQPPSGLRGDPGAPRTVNGEARDTVSSVDVTTSIAALPSGDPQELFLEELRALADVLEGRQTPDFRIAAAALRSTIRRCALPLARPPQEDR